MRKVLAVLVCSLALAGCVAHEKEGDSAAAVGDWKTAYSHYQAALREKSDTPGLKEKYDNAKNNALGQSWTKAQGCEQTQDWNCALGEAEFVLTLEPTHPGAVALRARAATQQALGHVNEARMMLAQRQYVNAYNALKTARQKSADPQVQQQASMVEQEIVTGGSAEADRLRQARNYKDSIAMYDMLASIDPRFNDQAARVRAEEEAFVMAQYEAEAQRGDKALDAYDFRAALQAYQAAEAIRPNGRAAPLIRYTQAMVQADDALKAHDYAGAEAALRNAIATGKDRGPAADMLERVRVKPYKVGLRSVLIQPARLDGSAWAGATSALFFRIATQVGNAMGKSNSDLAIQMAMNLPYENRPNIHVEVLLADGTVLSSNATSGVYAPLSGEFIIAGNQFDESRIAFRVVQEAKNEEIGRVEVALRDLFAKRDLSLNSQTIIKLDLDTQAAEGRQAGTFVGLTKISQPAAVAGTTTTTGTPTGTAAAGGNPGGNPGATPYTPPGTATGGKTVTTSGSTTGTTTPAGTTPATTTPTPKSGTTTTPPPPPANSTRRVRPAGN